MRRYVILGSLLAVFVAGCSKEPPAAATSTNATVVPTQDQPAAPAASPTAAVTNAAPDLRALTLSLHHWIMRNQRHPANFEEFAAGADIPIPPAPPGKKYAIDRSMSVILVNQ